ncbi:MAG TPA: hypothetical protein VHW60_00215 [Caulobacteraceae bacterium]|jgi:hypothetical protein|nr:hypothetical protein [Caulobacteraceae bacterium]
MSSTQLTQNWRQLLAASLFASLAAVSITLPIIFPDLGNGRSEAAINAAISIGTGGVVSFVFYYVVNVSSERTRIRLLQEGVKRTYQNAKWDIALAVLQASRKGGRRDLVSTTDNIEKCLTIAGFRSLFLGGGESYEGFYAFQNQMSDPTYEFEKIIFNLNVFRRAVDRLIGGDGIREESAYNYLLQLSIRLDRIERNGAGYDESKLLCAFVWEIFSGYNSVDGDIGYDKIERTIESLIL